MCGIAGIWVYAHTEKKWDRIIESMTDTISHRGPDAKATWCNGNGVYLGHTRLSIIDLSEKAGQPMPGHSQKTRIVFNGEIYNYREIRKQLKSEGIKFRSESDTEVILALYEKNGFECVNYLRGMFAFALWDDINDLMFLARDRLGKKPLYYTHFEDNLYFASEIKAIRAVVPQSLMEIDRRALDEYLSFGFISGEKTIYKNIRELLPGCLMVMRSPGNFEIERYWSPQWHPKKDLCFTDAVEEADNLLTDAVNMRLRSDVPVGIFLSGGIDSSLITAIAAKEQSNPCITFSVGFEDSLYDERPLAKTVAEQFGSNHHEILIKPDIVSILPKIAQAYDEPFADPSAIPSFYIAEYASNYVKVVLNGDGGDELFAGYRRHVATSVLEMLNRVYIGSIIKKYGNNILRIMPVPETHRTKYAFLHRFLRGVANTDNIERFLVWFSEGFNTFEKKELYRVVPHEDYGLRELESILTNLCNLEGLDQIMALDFVWSLPFDLLVKMDIATMANGLEARSPFLDQELVQWANMLPQPVKLSGITTKPILRELSKRYLPENIVNAPKRGFEIPLYKWLTTELKEISEDLILSQKGLVRDLFSKKYLEHLLNRKIKMEPGRWAVLIWILLMLALWDSHCYNPG